MDAPDPKLIQDGEELFAKIGDLKEKVASSSDLTFEVDRKILILLIMSYEVLVMEATK